MGETDAQAPLASEEEEAVAYERWKYRYSAFPFRFAFTGLLILGVALLVGIMRSWDTSYRWVASAFGLLYVVGSARLLYDIPQRRLSRLSRAFLGLGLITTFCLGAYLTLRALWSV